MTLRLLLVASALLYAALPVGRADSASNVSDFKLDNGLEVVVIPDHRTPVVTHMIWYKVGSADETPGKSGLAHFLEHLMFKGTAANPAGRFSKMVAEVGGQENAFTSSDFTGYYQRVAKEHLKMLMEFEADRMTGLVLSEDEVKPELKVVLEEFNQRVANNPVARLGEQIEAAQYLNHPYGRPVIGWRPEIEALTRDDALAFYRRFYTPNNAVVVVAGDVSAEEVRKLAEETYGKVKPRAEIGPRRRPQEPPQVAPRQVTLADPRVTQPSLQRTYLVPSDHTAKPGEAEALTVLTHILGTGTNSRLYQALVMERGIAVSIGAWYQSSALDSNRLGFYGTPKAGVTLQQLEDAIDEQIDAVVQKGVSTEELERAKNRLIADAIYANDNQATLARWYGSALTTGSTVERVKSWPDRMRAVTREAVNEAARQWLDRRRSVTGYLVKELPTRHQDKRS